MLVHSNTATAFPSQYHHNINFPRPTARARVMAQENGTIRDIPGCLVKGRVMAQENLGQLGMSCFTYSTSEVFVNDSVS